MSTLSNQHTSWGSRVSLLSAAALLALSLGTAPAVGGHDRHDDDEDYEYRHHRHSRSCGHHDSGYRGGHHDHGYRDGHYDRGHRRERFSVPGVIHRSHVRVYEDYYHGRAWFEPHDHHHQVYYFPVAVGHGYEHRPHHYCGGRLVRQNYVSYDGPRVRVRVGF